MYDAINGITNKAKAEKLFYGLFEAYTNRVGQASAAHLDKMTVGSSMYKPNGLAWWKDRCRSIAGALVASDCRVSHFIPQSPETLEWGGFLGGERLTYTDKKAEAAAEDMILDRIAGL